MPKTRKSLRSECSPIPSCQKVGVVCVLTGKHPITFQTVMVSNGEDPDLFQRAFDPAQLLQLEVPPSTAHSQLSLLESLDGGGLEGVRRPGSRLQHPVSRQQQQRQSAVVCVCVCVCVGINAEIGCHLMGECDPWRTRPSTLLTKNLALLLHTQITPSTSESPVFRWVQSYEEGETSSHMDPLPSMLCCDAGNPKTGFPLNPLSRAQPTRKPRRRISVVPFPHPALNEVDSHGGRAPSAERHHVRSLSLSPLQERPHGTCPQWSQRNSLPSANPYSNSCSLGRRVEVMTLPIPFPVLRKFCGLPARNSLSVLWGRGGFFFR